MNAIAQAPPTHTATRTAAASPAPAVAPVTPATPYAKLGGAPALRQLVHRFYGLMDELPEAWAIRQMHPTSLAGSEDSLFMFLSGWLGGPPLFMDNRGHPRLRMRHAPYTISGQARDEWLLCMRMALAEQVADEPFRDALVMAFEHMAQHLINDDGSHWGGHDSNDKHGCT
jgi:hemoglobin